MAVWSQSYLKREDGHGVRGAGLLGVLSGAPSSSTTVRGAVQPERWRLKGLGSQVPVLPSKGWR